LQLRGAERIALGDLAGGEAALEPPHALCGGAVRERLRRHATLRPALQPIVADGRGGAQTFLEIARLENVTGAIGVVRPDPGEAVGLQLAPDRDRRRPASSARVARAREPEQLLNVVAHLVRDDVRLRDVAGSAEAVAQL